MDHIEVTNLADPLPPSNIDTDNSATLEVQAPLPLDPTPDANNVKQEMVDEEYDSSPSEGTLSKLQNHEPLNNPENTKSYKPNTAIVSIFRDYVKGACKHPRTCKYPHKYDLTQLVRVSTFCRNYQTSVSTFPNCIYVHAAVFKEHHFYWTGILQPSPLTHYKKLNTLHLPLPPPPPPINHPTNSSVNTNVSMNLTFPNPQPPLQNELLQEDVGNMIPPRSPVLKRQCHSIEHVSSSASDRDGNDPLAKKCKYCDETEMRLKYINDEYEEMLLSKETLRKKMLVLDEKRQKLSTILSLLLSLRKGTQSDSDSLDSSHSSEKDESLLDKSKSIISVTCTLFPLGEEE